MTPARKIPGYFTFEALLVLTLVVLAFVFLPLWKPMLLAVVLAATLARLQERLSAKLRGRRKLAAGLVLAGLVVLILIPVAALGTFVVREVIAVVGFVRLKLEAGGFTGLVAEAPARLQPLLHKLVGALPDLSGAIPQRAAAQGAAAAAAVGGALSSSAQLVFHAAMMLVALFFLLVDGKNLVAWLRGVSPLGPKRTHELLANLRQTSSSILTSVVATAAIQGTTAGIGYWIAHVPYPLVFALLTFFCAFIPSVGTTLVSLPVAIGMLLSGHLGWGIFLLVWAVGVVGTIDNVLKPVLMKSGAEMNGVLIFFAMIGGIVTFGGIGLLVGPLSLSFFLALVRLGRTEYVSPDAQRRVLPADPGTADELPQHLT